MNSRLQPSPGDDYRPLLDHLVKLHFAAGYAFDDHTLKIAWTAAGLDLAKHLLEIAEPLAELCSAGETQGRTLIRLLALVQTSDFDPPQNPPQ